jgi:predicted short-subunit dehydrogenase-like oxidoreductase (DUF2520 family)
MKGREFQAIGFIGAGTLGTALAVSFAQRGHPVTAVGSRTYSSAQRLAARVPGCQPCTSLQQVVDACDLVFLTVPDDAIAPVTESLSWRSGKAAAHCSGAKPLEVLEAARGRGALVGSLHPLQTFSTVDQALESLAGSIFALEAEPPLLEHLQGLVQALDGRSLVLPPGSRTLYHASAVMVCGYLVALADRAAGLWETFGMDRRQALDALLPLMEGTLRSLDVNGIPQAVTGPLVRGDVGTVRAHLQALERLAPELLPLYCRLGLETLELADAKAHLDTERKRELETLFTAYAQEGFRVPA